MRMIPAVLLIFIGIIFSAFAEYKEGWDYANFYESVEKCRESIVISNIQSYENKGKEKKQDKDELKEELITITPVFDKIASDNCFCIFNEVAKDKTFEEFKKGMDLEPYMNIPRCKENVEKLFESKGKLLNDLKLK